MVKSGNRGIRSLPALVSVSLAAVTAGVAAVSPAAAAAQAAEPTSEAVMTGTAAVDSAPVPYDGSVAVSAPTAAAPQPETRSSGSRFVEEIVVTAQKREENLQDVPISVSAFSAEMLDAKGVDNPADLQKTTPGLTYTTAVGFSLIYLRGVGSDAFLMADPSVALYIDGVYFPFAQGLAQSFGALERIEVLKGPQGTLFGRNAVGGAINIITKAPSSEHELSVQTSYADYDQLRLRAHTNIPVTDEFAFSVSAFYNSEDTYYEGSTSDGVALPQDTGKGARVKARWVPAENLDLTLSAFRLNQSGAGSLFTPNIAPSQLFRTIIQPQQGFDADLSYPVLSNLNNTVFYAEVNANFAPFDVKLLASDQDIQTAYSYDYDGSDVPIAGFDAEKQYARVKSAELQLLSNPSSWGADWLNWIGGVYCFTGKQGFDPVNFALVDFDLAGGSLAGAQVPRVLTDALISVLGPLDVVPNLRLPLKALLGTDSIAAFAQATATVTDWFSVTIGARYQVEDRSVLKSSSHVETLSGDFLPVPLCDGVNGGDLTGCFDPNFDLDRRTKSFKPKVSFDFRPIDDVLVYLSYQQALKSSTFNAVTLYDAPEFVKPEELDAYEVGVKSKLFDGLMTVNAAAFQYDIENAQVQFVSVVQGGAVSFENAGKTRIRGIDFDTLVLILPDSIDDLVLTASGAFLDGEYTDYRNARGYDEVTGLAFQNGDFSGNETVRTPKFSGVLGLSKTFQFGSGALELATDAYYNKGFYFSPQNSEASLQDAYTLLNARISYLYAPWQLRVTVFGSNLTDKRYQAGQFATDFGTNAYLGAPVSYGVRLNWDL